MVQSGLVGHWPLHEWNGRANDISGNGAHGTLSGGPVQGVAAVGGLTGYSFDASDDWVDFGNAVDSAMEPPTTASMFVRKENDSSVQTFFEHGGGRFRMSYEGEGTEGYELEIYDGSTVQLATSNVYTTGEWVHVVGQHDGTTGFLYVNGELKDTVTHPVGEQVQGTNIGARGAPNDFFGGSMADVRVYDRVLSPTEINYLYRAGSADVATPPNASDPDALTRIAFDDLSDTSTAVDSWSNNGGPINGPVYSSDSIRGLAMDFTASNNDRVELGNLGLNKSQSFTVSAWAKKESDVNGHIFGRYDGTTDIVEMKWRSSTSGRSLDVRVGEAGGNELQPSGGVFTEGSWYNFAMVYDSSQPSLTSYANGVEIASADNAVDDFADTDGPWIGARSDNVQHFDGKIDDVRVYTRALSDHEVQQLYQWGTRGVDRRHEVIRQ